MSDTLARLTWLALLQAAVVGVVVLAYRAIGSPTRTEGTIAVALVLAARPLDDALVQGQVGIIVAFLVTAALFANSRRRSAAAGSALGLAIALKVTPLLLVAYLAWKRAWRTLAFAGAGLLVLVALTLMAGWLPRWDAYFRLLRSVGAGTPFGSNQSIDGFLLRLVLPAQDNPFQHPPGWITGLSLALRVGIVGLVAALVLRLRSRLTEPLWLEVSIVLLALPMLQPFAWVHHWVIALLAIPVGCRLVARSQLAPVAIAGLVAAVLFGELAAVIPDQPEILVSTWLFSMLLAILCLGLGARDPDPKGAG